MTTHCTNPCPACPFKRTVKPGALGGSPPETFIGQAHGPFVLPCHKHCDFTDPDWKAKALTETPQCAGAAIYRANTGRAQLMPPGIHKLPEDRGRVFASPAEFLAHHDRLPEPTASARLKLMTPENLMLRELLRDGVRT